MKAEAVVNLYSGLPNPRWALTLSEVSQLRLQVLALQPAERILRVPPARGYRGLRIVIREDGVAKPQVIRLFESFVTVNGQTFADPGRTVEYQLLARAPVLGDLNVTVAELVGPYNEQPIEGIEGSTETRPCASAPAYPETTGSKKGWKFNNCYSYANNERNTDKKFSGAQPGNGSALTAAALIAAAGTDGLDHLGATLPSCSEGSDTHYFALVLMHHASHKIKDYHCLRLDNNGQWSHKNGPHEAVTNKDDTDNVMYDLSRVLLFWNPTLVGFFRSAKSRRRIQFS